MVYMVGKTSRTQLLNYFLVFFHVPSLQTYLITAHAFMCELLQHITIHFLATKFSRIDSQRFYFRAFIFFISAFVPIS